MSDKIRVIILDDHQSIVDGYLFRLGNIPQIEVVAALSLGEEIELALAKFPAEFCCWMWKCLYRRMT